MREHRSAIIAGIVGVALAALIALFAFSPKGEDPAESTSSPLVGKLAPVGDASHFDRRIEDRSVEPALCTRFAFAKHGAMGPFHA